MTQAFEAKVKSELKACNEHDWGMKEHAPVAIARFEAQVPLVPHPEDLVGRIIHSYFGPDGGDKPYQSGPYLVVHVSGPFYVRYDAAKGDPNVPCKRANWSLLLIEAVRSGNTWVFPTRKPRFINEVWVRGGKFVDGCTGKPGRLVVLG